MESICITVTIIIISFIVAVDLHYHYHHHYHHYRYYHYHQHFHYYDDYCGYLLHVQDEFEATNACVYEVERRLEEQLAEVRSDVSLASAECRQQALTEAVRTSKLQLDNLHDRLITRIQGTTPSVTSCMHAYSGLQ